VTRTRQDFLTTIANHEWSSPDVQSRATEDLLALLDTVPYDGDDHAYMMAAWTKACEFMNPLVVEQRELVALRRRFENLLTSGTVN
jgi:hypothetical protein